MKVAIASTDEQDEHIQKLVDAFYTTIFPRFFSDEQIQDFEKWNVLHIAPTDRGYIGTLKEAFQIISILQTIISIIEMNERGELEAKYEDMFEENVEKLQQFGISFPFTFEQFQEPRSNYYDEISVYGKAANEVLA
ncbi:DUF5365 family protein [Bacillus fonticola]|uniref:DUF5365 family protein n=1 Tax=Bacillus fonticola TaxID=2728853 RepID=UPI001473187A|nr:DUF5365 family protein [Bacillus fonticola]